MIFANELYHQDNKCFRILWVDERSDRIACIAIEDNKGLPELVSLADMLSLIGEGIVAKSDDDPYSSWPPEEWFSDTLKKKRDKNWLIIESLVRSEPEIFLRNQRSRLLREKCDETGVSLATLYKFLRRYWQRGLCKNALLPDYRKCGMRGVPKRAGKAKRGRPSLDPCKIRGINIDDVALENIKVSLNRHYWNQEGKTLAFAHQQMLEKFYRDLNHETGELELRSAYPLLATYRYWAERLIGRREKKRIRLGPISYEKDHRPILSTSNVQVLGPGSRYQIDATIGD